jgi:RloB-like protein
MGNSRQNHVLKKQNLSMAKRRQRTLKRIIYVACEGTKTEYWYFKSLNESLEPDANVELRIYPDPFDQEEIQELGQKGVKTDHKSLCDKASEKLKGNEGIDEAWIVIDKDRHLALQETFDKAKKTGVQVAFSSISFEHWLLLHFEKNGTAFLRSDCKNDAGRYVKCGSEQPNFPDLDCKGERCVSGRIRFQKHLPNFDKSNQTIFKATEQYHTLAFENATWLRWQKELDLVVAKGIFEVNPITTVDKLLKSIYENSLEISWVKWQKSIKIKDFDVIGVKNPKGFVITFTNISGKSQVVLMTHFYFSNEKAEVLDDAITFKNGIRNYVILPNSTIEVELFARVLNEKVFLNFKFGDQRVVFSD